MSEQQDKIEAESAGIGGAWIGADPVQVIPIGKMSQVQFTYEQDYQAYVTFRDPLTGNTQEIRVQGNDAKAWMQLLDRAALIALMEAQGHLPVGTAMHVDNSDLDPV